MARTGSIVKNERRRKAAARGFKKRVELRNKAVNMKLSDEERDAARLALQKLPKNSAPTRVRNRCVLSGRPRGFLRKFGLSRIAFRDAANRGLIPGVTKASW